MRLENGKAEVQQFHERPAVIVHSSRDDHDVGRLDGTMRQREKCSGGECPNDLNSDAQHRVRSHRTVRDDPRVGGFAFDVELCYLAKRLGYTVTEIPAYVSEEHSYKRSKVNLVKDPIRMFAALVDVRVNALLGRYGKR